MFLPGFRFLKYILSSGVGANLFCLYNVFYSTVLILFRVIWIQMLKMGLCKEDKQLGGDISLCCLISLMPVLRHSEME